MYRVEATVRICLTNEWVSNRKTIEKRIKDLVKDLDLSRKDFGQRGEKKRPFVASPEKRFDPLKL